MRLLFQHVQLESIFLAKNLDKATKADEGSSKGDKTVSVLQCCLSVQNETVCTVYHLWFL